MEFSIIMTTTKDENGILHSYDDFPAKRIGGKMIGIVMEIYIEITIYLLTFLHEVTRNGIDMENVIEILVLLS